jgi:hypothetical protein
LLMGGNIDFLDSFNSLRISLNDILLVIIIIFQLIISVIGLTKSLLECVVCRMGRLA